MRTGLRKHQRHNEIRRQLERPTTKYVDEWWEAIRAKVEAERIERERKQQEPQS